MINLFPRSHLTVSKDFIRLPTIPNYSYDKKFLITKESKSYSKEIRENDFLFKKTLHFLGGVMSKQNSVCGKVKNK